MSPRGQARPGGGRLQPGAAALLVAALAPFLPACGGPSRAVLPDSPSRRPADRAAEGPRPPAPPPGLLAALPVATRDRILSAAERWLGRTGPFQARGRHFRADCSGYVEAAYEAAGIPILDAFDVRPEDEWRASAALQRAARELGVLYGAEREPLPGDLVFFARTYDPPGGDRERAGVTHVGLVLEVRQDGAVSFLHRGSRGVARGALDLRDPGAARGPGGAARNTPLRAARAGEPRGTRHLAGELFAGFGRIDPARVAAVLDGNARLDLAALGYGEEGRLEIPVR